MTAESFVRRGSIRGRSFARAVLEHVGGRSMLPLFYRETLPQTKECSGGYGKYKHQRANKAHAPASITEVCPSPVSPTPFQHLAYHLKE